MADLSFSADLNLPGLLGIINHSHLYVKCKYIVVYKNDTSSFLAIFQGTSIVKVCQGTLLTVLAGRQARTNHIIWVWALAKTLSCL